MQWFYLGLKQYFWILWNFDIWILTLCTSYLILFLLMLIINNFQYVIYIYLTNFCYEITCREMVKHIASSIITAFIVYSFLVLENLKIYKETVTDS